MVTHRDDDISRKRLLCLSYRFPPETYPTALRLEALLGELRERWTIDVITAAEAAQSQPNLAVHQVDAWAPTGLLSVLHRFRLHHLLVWPDPYVFWVIPALLEAREIIRERTPDAVVVFMMPHSTGFAGLLLKKLTGLPIVFNLDDSPTCSDMKPTHPSRLHYLLSRWMEDRYVESGDAVVYVSERNLERVQARQAEDDKDKFHLVRYGANVEAVSTNGQSRSPVEADQKFRIVYVGGMSGWYGLHSSTGQERSKQKEVYRSWLRWLRHHTVEHYPHSHSPVYIGQAVRRIVEENPAWKGRIEIHIYGNYPSQDVVDQVLRQYELEDIVSAHESVSHEESLRLQREADLLFMALPARLDGSAGGRISAKTYEYLATDRPILAALPSGENRDYLEDKPGVHLTEPMDVDGMARVIDDLAGEKFAGHSISVDRSSIRPALSYEERARAFEEVLNKVI